MDKLPKLKVGQKVRFKSNEELKRIGERWSVEVNTDFKYFHGVLTIKGHTSSEKERLYDRIEAGNYYEIDEWRDFSTANYWLHEDFFQPAYELDEKFKEL